MRHFSHTAACAISIKTGPAQVLAKCLLRRNARGSRGIECVNLFGFGLHNVPVGQCVTETRTVHGRAVEMEQIASRQLTEDGHHSARTVYVFHVVERRAGCDLAELWDLA